MTEAKLTEVLLQHTPVDLMGDKLMLARTQVKCVCDQVWRRADDHVAHQVEALAFAARRGEDD